MRTVSYRRFNLTRENGALVFACEVSSLFPDWPSFPDRVYPDSCDVGLQVWGKMFPVNYVLEEEVTREGETIMWRLVPTPESVRKVPSCVNTRVVIFND